MRGNPYESPATIDGINQATAATLSLRRLLSDGLAGSLVGATYASLGVAVLTTARMAFSLSGGQLSQLEQLLFAFVAGAFLGALIGTLMGGVVGGVLGGLFRWFRLEATLRFFWVAVLIGSMLGALIGMAGGILLVGRGWTAGGDPAALIWCPLGAVLGGMLGALAGRKWVQMVGGPLMCLPWGNPQPAPAEIKVDALREET